MSTIAKYELDGALSALPWESRPGAASGAAAVAHLSRQVMEDLRNGCYVSPLSGDLSRNASVKTLGIAVGVPSWVSGSESSAGPTQAIP